MLNCNTHKQSLFQFNSNEAKEKNKVKNRVNYFKNEHIVAKLLPFGPKKTDNLKMIYQKMIANMAQLTKAIDLQTLQDSIQIESILIENKNNRLTSTETTSSLLKPLDLIFEDTTLDNNGVSQYIRSYMGGQIGAPYSRFSTFHPIISK